VLEHIGDAGLVGIGAGRVRDRQPAPASISASLGASPTATASRSERPSREHTRSIASALLTRGLTTSTKIASERVTRARAPKPSTSA